MLPSAKGVESHNWVKPPLELSWAIENIDLDIQYTFVTHQFAAIYTYTILWFCLTMGATHNHHNKGGKMMTIPLDLGDLGGPLESDKRNLELRMLRLRLPIRSMYGIFTNIYPKNHPNVGKYTIHGAYGL